MDQLHQRQVRSVYLITYSQADIEKYTKQSFASMVVNAFEEGSVKVLQWVCCQESHTLQGEHFHVAIKLNKIRRWISVKRKHSYQNGIQVHFSSNHENYYGAWKYITKERNFIESEGHPDLSSASAPRTSNASRSKRKQTGGETSTQSKRERLDNLTIHETIIKNNIHCTNELLALANTQKLNGKTNLTAFILDKGIKKVSELIDTSWALTKASDVMLRSTKSRFKLAYDYLQKPCADDCDGIWLTTAIKTLQNNDINIEEYTHSIIQLLIHGRSKYRNLMIVGPANCGKTFMLQPLSVIYNCFQNPESNSFAWVGTEEAEVIILNDLRWNTKLISWNDFLLLLEGQPVHLPAPKSHFSKDILLTKDTPIFSTSSETVSLVRNGILLQKETEMMSVRWKVFKFFYQIAENEQGPNQSMWSMFC